MIFKDESEVIEYIKKHQSTEGWVNDARKYHKTLKALVTGEKFAEELIERIEKIESKDREIARRKYSKDIRDMFDRVMQPRLSIFSASGGSVKIEIQSEKLKEKFIQSLTHFKGQKSIKQYLAENFFRLSDTDPNGVIFMEYIKDQDIFPAYKSIDHIRHYKSNGQLLECVLFEPKNLKSGMKEWRVVDDATDYRILQNNTSFTIIPDKTFKHPFGKVPGVVLGDMQEMGSEKRVSALFPIEELSKDYARDKSILTIYKFQHGFPRHWRYIKECRACHGTGKDGTKSCKACDGKGELRVNDVTDITTLALPREDDPIVTPNIEGFVSPDLQTWERYTNDLKESEERIDNTMWGSNRIKSSTGEKTATEVWVNAQSVKNRLDKFADSVEFVHNKLAKFTENWVNGTPKNDSEYHKSYGRRFIVESPDALLDKYTTAREKGDPSTILDKLLDEYILSRYQNSPDMVEEMQKKRQVEPYIHISTKETFEIFGAKEANKKTLFVEFWEEADKDKSVQDLRKDFNEYVSQNMVQSEPVIN